MAVRKLSLPLFRLKARTSQPGCSTDYFHFIASIKRERNRYRCLFVCDSQPLMTFGSHGLLDRCPARGVLNPVQGECEC
jgi:hypothetical protein